MDIKYDSYHIDINYISCLGNYIQSYSLTLVKI